MEVRKEAKRVGVRESDKIWEGWKERREIGEEEERVRGKEGNRKQESLKENRVGKREGRNGGKSEVERTKGEREEREGTRQVE